MNLPQNVIRTFQQPCCIRARFAVKRLLEMNFQKFLTE